MGDPGKPRRRLLIAGAAGRDFHNFNLLFRADAGVEVVAFTAAQIPDIDDRRYPPDLAGPLYPHGIPIRPESELEALCRRHAVAVVHFAYSDLSHGQVMHLAARALAAGAGFEFASPAATMLRAARPVLAVSAVRTGCGKSQTSRWLLARLRERGLRLAVLRHPMPYGDLAAQAVQFFATPADLDAARCTIEEREEYEPYLELGAGVYAGVDYARILALAERDADLLLWDGGNNDTPFLCPDFHIVLADAMRPGHETHYHPGETNLLLADLAIVMKADVAPPAAADSVRDAIRQRRPGLPVLAGASPVFLDPAVPLRDRRVVVVDDGPTLTHGGMPHGAGLAAAAAAGATIVDPRPFAAPAIAAVFAEYPHLGPVLPAMGYGPEQVRDLAATIRASGADCVVAGTPVDLRRLLGLEMDVVRARYHYADGDRPGLWSHVEAFLRRRGL
jgi:predicted GTPase